MSTEYESMQVEKWVNLPQRFYMLFGLLMQLYC